MFKKAILPIAIASSLGLSAAEFTYTENDNSGNNVALGFTVPLPIDSLTPVDGFRSYQSLNLRHQQLTAMSEVISEHIIGTTINNRTIYAYQISDADLLTDDGRPEAAALINGGIHAREWQTPEALTGYMETFSGQYQDSHIASYITNNVNLVTIPVLNIDGFLQTQRFANKVTSTEEYPRDGRMRRKNMRDTDELLTTIEDNFGGVDLNRNSDPYWATSTGNGSSDNPNSIVYHGTSAASEPEIQALQAGAQLAGEEQLRFYTDTHSFTQVYLTPTTGNARRDSITEKLATAMRAANGFKYSYNAFNPGSGIGATDEYFANTYDIPSYTLEIEPRDSATQYGGNGVSHDGFILPNSEVARMREETSRAALTGLYSIADVPYLQGVEISKDGTIVLQQSWLQNQNERVLSKEVESELEAETTYKLKLVFNKPMRALENEQVVAFSNLSESNGVALNIRIKSGSQDSTLAIETSAGQWLVDSYERYKTDTFEVAFSLPSGFDWNNTSLLAFSVSTTDMVGQSLDASPATPVSWQSGAWQNYEDSQGAKLDAGGTDNSMRLIDDGSALFEVTDPPPPPEPPREESSSSSGGSTGYLMTILLTLLFIRKRMTFEK